MTRRIATDASERQRLMAFAEKGGVGKCTALCDYMAENQDFLRLHEGDEITVLMQLPDEQGLYLGYCAGVIGRFRGIHVRFQPNPSPVLPKRKSHHTTRIPDNSSTNSSNTDLPDSHSMFSHARDFVITGGVFNSVQGNYTQTQGSRANPPKSNATSHNPNVASEGSEERGLSDDEDSEPNQSSFVSLCAWFCTVLRDVTRYRVLLSYRGETAQRLLDAIQMLLDNPNLIDAQFRQDLLFALLRLSKASALYPKCYRLKNILREKDPVAAGHFGEIWRGDLKGRKVCLKVVKVYQNSHVDHLLKAFCKEAIVWRLLSHPNLLPFYGMYHLPDMQRRVCLVSPWMENGNIMEYLERYPDANRLNLISDIIHGISYLHEENVVHGDLKGVNILITSSGRACLADFGLSSVIDADIFKWTSVMSSSVNTGTLRWQAPELIDPKNETSRATKASDIYAFACTCYEIFTGRIPFPDILHDATVIYRVCFLGEKPVHPSPSGDNPLYEERGLTTFMWELMVDCWNSDPSSRPTVQLVLTRLPRGELRIANNGNEEGDTLSTAQFRTQSRIPNVISGAEVEYITSLVQ